MDQRPTAPMASVHSSSFPDRMDQGTVTVHYKASNRRLDLWFDNTKLLADFESYSGRYDLDFIQLGIGGISFENLLFNNVLLGVLNESGHPIAGDANGDGVVDVADLGIVGANFNADDMQWSTGVQSHRVAPGYRYGTPHP